MYLVTHPDAADCPASGPAERFQPTQLRRAIVARLRAYQTGLLAELRHEPETFLRFVRLVVMEANGLAWSTPYAHLFFPALAEEKIHYARQWTNRQCRIRTDLR